MNKTLGGVICGFLLCALLAGCAPMQGYPGARLARERVAVIYMHSEPMFPVPYKVQIWVVDVDGLSTLRQGAKIEVLPGKHVLKLGLHYELPLLLRPLVDPAKLQFIPGLLAVQVAPGGSYRLNAAEVEPYRFQAWVEDEHGHVVSGVRPERHVEPVQPAQ